MKIFEAFTIASASSVKPDEHWVREVDAPGGRRVSVGPFASRSIARSTASLLVIMGKLDAEAHHAS